MAAAMHQHSLNFQDDVSRTMMDASHAAEQLAGLIPMQGNALAKSCMDAFHALRPHMRHTPLLESAWLRGEAPGCVGVHLKMESEQHTGSFKARGALNKVRVSTKLGDQNCACGWCGWTAVIAHLSSHMRWCHSMNWCSPGTVVFCRYGD